ncbi:MAG: ATP-binding protein [Thermogemmatispora sp.]|uniref:DUF499 domain-containing protein n=1 Tax=Thermogemmatispora sp. TaxID=1968838 RepID=UPI00262764C0|nr:DUF499 domain-containing protein [Thermogemmatispora sp.]MBX5458190.1 ATP-binding protein [Thermogemmatispora sp.]
MSTGTPKWRPWHEIVRLRDELLSGDLSLASFAADLYDVVMQRGNSLYREPDEFFSLTYPTANMRRLAREVMQRLAGRSDRAVYQLELYYGGGKTHTLITLYHLARRPERLPKLPAVDEFLAAISLSALPRARIAVLAFDKLDPEKGLEIPGPGGERRLLRHPWSILAYQLAGSEGLRLIHSDGQDAERETPPAEELLTQLLSLPARQGDATLVLMDEVLIYVREKVSLDSVWRWRMSDFFQYLTQAANKVPTCAVVVSLLASDPRKRDELGRELSNELQEILGRQREPVFQPVEKDDVAEVLRRRFFTPDSIRNRDLFRSQAIFAVNGIASLVEEVARQRHQLEERVAASYPFHPDLIDLFYGKWTDLQSFQGTRGTLRNFALALRDAARWDACPLVSVNAFLGPPNSAALSEVALELATTAENESYEGRRQAWSAILESELAKARQIQRDFPALRFREIEQAVFATFLHSQPVGRSANLHELLRLIGQMSPDRIALVEALKRWTEVSWFLDESTWREREALEEQGQPLPKVWRLGARPNLRQMHHDACQNISPEAIESYLRQEIESCSYLAPSRASYPPSVHIHKLPREPRDVDDDGDLRLVILGPEGACRPERPSELALRFLNEKSGPEAPRVYRNAIIVVAPHSRGLDGAREAIRSYLGWCDVEERLKREEQEIDSNRQVLLEREKKESEVRLKELVRESYCIVVAFSASNVAEAFQIKPGSNLYASLRADERVRLSEQPIEAEALLPGGPYELWREGETARRYKDLLDAFAQFVHLPRIVDRNAIKQTLINGCLQGQFVFRQPRPDRSYRTCWRQRPDEEVLRDPALEVVLAEEASLTSLAPELLQPGALPGLWEGDELPLSRLYAYFAGGHVVEEQRDGYSETLIIPRAESAAIRQAVREAVRGRQLWLLSGRSSFLGEEVADDVLSEQARLRRPRDPLAASEILPENLPAAWQGEQTTARAIADALAERFGVPLPWLSVQAAIEDAFQQRLLERSLDSGPWPCDYAGARAVKILVVHPEAVHAGLQSTLMGAASASTLRERPLTYAPLVRAEAPVDSGVIQSLAEVLPELLKICGDHNLNLRFQLAIEVEPASRVTGEVLERLNALLGSEVSPELTFRPPSG